MKAQEQSYSQCSLKGGRYSRHFKPKASTWCCISPVGKIHQSGKQEVEAQGPYLLSLPLILLGILRHWALHL
jgi:hypothetical protein